MRPKVRLLWSAGLAFVIACLAAYNLGDTLARRVLWAIPFHLAVLAAYWWDQARTFEELASLPPNTLWRVREAPSKKYAAVAHFCRTTRWDWRRAWWFVPGLEPEPAVVLMPILEVPQVRHCIRCGERVDQPLATSETKRWNDLVNA